MIYLLKNVIKNIFHLYKMNEISNNVDFYLCICIISYKYIKYYFKKATCKIFMIMLNKRFDIFN